MDLILSVLGLASPMGLAALAATFLLGLFLKQPKIKALFKKINPGIDLIIQIRKAVADGKITPEELDEIKKAINAL